MEVLHKRDGFHRLIAWTVVGALLFLRIPFSVYITYVYPNNEQWGPDIYQVGTYFLIAFLIWWEMDSLIEFHMDALAVMMVLVFKPVQTLILNYWGLDIPLAFPHPVSLSIWVIAVGLIMALWCGGYKPGPIPVNSWKWLCAGLLTGFALSSLQNLDVFLVNTNIGRYYTAGRSTLTTSTSLVFLYQLGFAAVSEEPLFRGFLWGYLRKSGLRDTWVWLVQAGLFMSAHLYFKDALPFNFWVAVPAAGLILGLLAWRSRSTGAGMMAHAAYNAGVYIILLKLIPLLYRT
jgi:membrane protease YdiL (CAAX protease family)